MLREYIISEAMSALGIPTTRSLAVVSTGEPVYRASALKGAILVRVAASHLRVGTFQYLAARRDTATLKMLVDYAMARHYPDLAGGTGVPSATDQCLRFFRAVMDLQAALIAQSQLVGFIHGVMNTDNMAISGETIDYGPCAFMNTYRPETVFSSIDQGGRYAYDNQPSIGQWNLARFAETLLPLLDSDPEKGIAIATEAIGEFSAMFERHWLAGMRKKVGLQTDESGDVELIQALLNWMQESNADFTNTFRDLSLPAAPVGDRYQSPAFLAWYAQWRLRQSRDGHQRISADALMRSVNPAVIPRNHRVEEALSAAEEHDDLAVLHRLLASLAAPYEDVPSSAYRDPPADDRNYRTYCGT